VGGGSGFGFRLKAGAKLCAGGARGHLHRQRYRCCRPRNRSRIEAPAVPLPRSPSQDGVEVLGEETGWSLLVTSPHVLLGFFFSGERSSAGSSPSAVYASAWPIPVLSFIFSGEKVLRWLFILLHLTIQRGACVECRLPRRRSVIFRRGRLGIRPP